MSETDDRKQAPVERALRSGLGAMFGSFALFLALVLWSPFFLRELFELVPYKYFYNRWVSLAFEVVAGGGAVALGLCAFRLGAMLSKVLGLTAVSIVGVYVLYSIFVRFILVAVHHIL